LAEQGGLVTNGTTEWVKLKPADRKDSQQTVRMEYTKRAIDLDDLLVPSSHVITGVKFRTLGRHVNLEVQVSSTFFKDWGIWGPIKIVNLFYIIAMH